MNQTCNIVELFSGIGSQAKALKNLGYEINTLGTCEWDLHAFIAYDAIHNSAELPEDVAQMKKEDILKKLSVYTLSNNGKEKMEYKTLKTYSEEALRRVYAAIRRSNNFVDVSSLTGDKMPEGVDILTYSFPCQDLSNVGAFHGYNKGIDKDWIYRKVFYNFSVTKMRLWGYVLYDKLKVYPKYNAALVTLTHSELMRFYASKGDTEGLVNQALQIKGMRFSCFLREEQPGKINVSLRSVDDFPCNAVAAEFFNGGGHKNASGGELYGTMEMAVERFRQALQKYKAELTE